MITFEVLGVPAPKGSSRAMMKGGHAINVPSGSNANRDKIKAWSTAVREQALEACGADRTAPVFVCTALSVEIVFCMARPMGHWGKGKNAGKLVPTAPQYPATKPDIDKLVRTTLDAMTGLVFDDDSRISRLVATKEWARPGHEGAVIVVRERSSLPQAFSFASDTVAIDTDTIVPWEVTTATEAA